MLRRPHDHHRDLQAWLHPTLVSNRPYCKRHFMITRRASQRPDPRRSCRSSTDRASVHSPTQPRPQPKLSASLKIPTLPLRYLLDRRTPYDHSPYSTISHISRAPSLLSNPHSACGAAIRFQSAVSSLGG